MAKYNEIGGEMIKKIEVDDTLKDTYTKIWNVTASQRSHLKPAFQDFDRTSTGRISLAQFKRAMDIRGIKNITDDEYDLIDKKFKTADGSIN